MPEPDSPPESTPSRPRRERSARYPGAPLGEAIAFCRQLDDRGLDRLPADQRRALVLHHLCDLSVAQVAEEVGAPTGTVKARLSRGRTALQQLLTANEMDEGASRA